MASSSEYFFEASDGAKIFVRRLEPPAGTPPKAVVHINHGLSEHTGRYAPFALRLVSEGFVVAMHDSRGQGQTATAEGAKGYGKVEPGKTGVVPRMLLDLEELLAETHRRYPSLRILLFGHSFGTVMSQVVAGSGAGGLPIAGIALSAPPGRIPPSVRPVFNLLLAGLHRFHGDMGHSELSKKMTADKWNEQTLAKVKKEQESACGGRCSCFSFVAAPKAKPLPKPTGAEWLNRDQAEVQKFLDDPTLGQPLGMAYWRSVIDTVALLSHRATHAKLPAKTPVLVLAGDSDFCALDAFGTPSYRCIQQELAAARKPPPKVIVYPGARHELLFELCKQDVMDDIVSFFRSALRTAVEVPEKEERLGADNLRQCAV